MLDLNGANLPGTVVTLLQLRGVGLPPLEWAIGANRFAKRTLDGLGCPAELLERSSLADERAAEAVWALLYLWNGWPLECATHAERSPERDRAYLLSLTARQSGHPAAAREALAGADVHPAFAPLAAFARGQIGTNADATLCRFKLLLERTARWEPSAFIDVYEAARADKLSRAAVAMVRAIQCQEFELLFVHCYEAAVGAPLERRPADNEDAARERLRQRRRREEVRRHRPAPTPDSSRRETPARAAAAKLAAPAEITLRCPRCRQELCVPESARGSRTQCGKCRAVFLVPGKDRPAGAGPVDPALTVGVRCPKCTHLHVVPLAGRGTTRTCAECGAAFLIPQ